MGNLTDGNGRSKVDEMIAQAPKLGSVGRAMWELGAATQQAITAEGVNDENREVVDMFDSMRDASYTGDSMVSTITAVYGPGLPWATRRRLAWQLIRGYRRRRWYAETTMFSNRDIGLAVRWDRDDTGLHIWVTFLALVVHARRAA